MFMMTMMMMTRRRKAPFQQVHHFAVIA